MSENTKSSTEFDATQSTIISGFLEAAGQGDKGNLEAFFTTVVKELNKDLETIQRDEARRKFEYETNLEELQDQLEDTDVAVRSALMDIDVEQIKTNASRKDYVNKYLRGLNKAQTSKSTITNQIASLKEEYDKQTELINAEIADINSKLSAVTA